MKQIQIKVLGIGGAGGNALKQLEKELDGVDFCAINTDAQALEELKAREKYLLGEETSRGLSTGGDTALARKLVDKEKDALGKLIKNVDLLFIIAGLGGGTGTGASASIANMARKQGSTVIAFVTLPFTIEGSRRHQIAQQGLVELRSTCNAVIPLPNDLLLQQLDAKDTVLKAFKHSNDWIVSGISAILDTLSTTGLINVDYSTLKNALSNTGGRTLFGIGRGKGEECVHRALNNLMLCPLLHIPHSTQGADALIVSIKGGAELELKMVNDIGNAVSQRFQSKEETVINAIIDKKLKQSIEITVIGVSDRVRSTQRKPARSTKDLPGQQVLFDEAYEPAIVVEKDSDGGSIEPTTDRGYFYKTQKNLYNGEDLDIPTYLRRGLKISLK